MINNDIEEDAAYMLKWVTAIAQKQHIQLNPDTATVTKVIRGLSANKEKYGRPYCPCRVRTGNEETDRDIECPCRYLKTEIDVRGRCTCRLYIKGEP